MEIHNGYITNPPNMQGLPHLVNEGEPFLTSIAGLIIVFAAIVTLGQLMFSYSVIKKKKSNRQYNPSIIAKMEYLGLGMVFFAIVTLYWIVPEPPYLHLYNPGHWGLMGFFIVVIVILVLRQMYPTGSRWESPLYCVGLSAMPLVYIAGWIIFGGSYEELVIEVVGALIFVCIALWGLKKSSLFLAVGIMLHGVWDILHWQTISFIPDWYIVGCALVDFTLGGYVLSRLLSIEISQGA